MCSMQGKSLSSYTTPLARLPPKQIQFEYICCLPNTPPNRDKFEILISI